MIGAFDILRSNERPDAYSMYLVFVVLNGRLTLLSFSTRTDLTANVARPVYARKVTSSVKAGNP